MVYLVIGQLCAIYIDHTAIKEQAQNESGWK
jgi:hypothetical protein